MKVIMCLFFFQLRIICKLLEEETDSATDSLLFDYIEACLRHKSETVVYEAACVVVNLRRTAARELAPAISVLQLFCGSSKSQLRFAAVRTLNKVGSHFSVNFRYVKFLWELKKEYNGHVIVTTDRNFIIHSIGCNGSPNRNYDVQCRLGIPDKRF